MAKSDGAGIEGTRMAAGETSTRVALVTGAAQGIGRAIARRLLQDGYAVILGDVDERNGRLSAEELERDARGRVGFERLDVSDEASVEAICTAVKRRFGRLDALVNNAGIASVENGPIEDLELARWNTMIATNLTGVFLCAKHAVRMLRESRGAIVNVASTRARMSEPHTEIYTAAKGGVVALTHALAMSLGPDVRVNVVSPGWIDVSSEHRDHTETAQVARESHDFHPVGRVGRPSDVASLVSFLLSESAGFITGAEFVADGGVTRKMVYE